MSDYRLGAWPREDGTQFYVWSDKAAEVSVRWRDERSGRSGELTLLPEIGEPRVHAGFEPRLGVGALYELFVDGERCVDPYARSLPQGVHGPAEIVSLPARLNEKREIDLARGEVFYELHVGTFTAEGTFDAVARRLPELAELGVTVIELMPIASFPGQRGWGYDGVALFAPFAPYGTVYDVRALLEAAHACGLSVVLDVVYNHLGPDGNYLARFSDSYFHHDRDNAWGKAPALDKDEFRELVLSSARYWLEEVGFDGLRLDAAHELEPGGEPHILNSLASLARGCSPPALLAAEHDHNTPAAVLAHGVDAVWSDDFHHCLHVLLTSEHDGYYAGYDGSLLQLAQTIERGQLYEGQVFPPTGLNRGAPSAEVPRQQLMYALQNHDQVGNRALGERLSSLCTPARFQAARLLMLFLPATPILFMGEEVLSDSPFLYFTNHEGELGKAITEGRRKEFARFAAFSASGASVPDPQDEAAFLRSKVVWQSPEAESARSLLRQALQLRREDPVLRAKREIDVGVEGPVLYVSARNDGGRRLLAFNTGNEPIDLEKLGDDLPETAAVLLASAPCNHDTAAFRLPAQSCVIFSLNES